MKKNKVTVIYNTAVKDIVIKEDKACGVITEKNTVTADAVIVATGGLSYPSTGSTGDGYKFAEKAGLINYEVLCSLSRRVPRVYIKNGSVFETTDYML